MIVICILVRYQLIPSESRTNIIKLIAQIDFYKQYNFNVLCQILAQYNLRTFLNE